MIAADRVKLALDVITLIVGIPWFVWRVAELLMRGWDGIVLLVVSLLLGALIGAVIGAVWYGPLDFWRRCR